MVSPLFLSLIATGVLALTAKPAPSDSLPIIDLGYEKHQAISFNETTGLYLFQNIRYARPPTGELRFRAPVAPEKNRRAVQNGAEPRTCPQGIPQWQGKAGAPIGKYSKPGVPFDIDDWVEDIRNAAAPDLSKLGPVTEDCLFLDLHVPKKVLQKASRHLFEGVPVLVWIHGGGYTSSSKIRFPQPGFFPEGLIAEASEKHHDDGMIFVALNYRLGALGFLAGPEVSRNGDLNAGLLDQRFALKWVQKHVRAFGGNKHRVTVMGESAGGGSVLTHVAAYGGKHGAEKLFARAIPQSPAFVPLGIPPKNAYKDFLAHLGVDNLRQARQLDSETVIAANAAMIGAAPPSTSFFAPVVDGDLIPDNLATMFRKGQFDQSIPILVGHNTLEGGFFFDPEVETEKDFKTWIDRGFPGLGHSNVKHLVETLYPPVFDGTYGYHSQATRQIAFSSEAIFDCHYEAVGHGKKGHSYAYEFAVSPGIHTQDLFYTFGRPSAPAPWPKAQHALQEAIVSFTKGHTPRYDSKRAFPEWGRQRNIVRIDTEGGHIAKSHVNETRCNWWSEL